MGSNSSHLKYLESEEKVGDTFDDISTPRIRPRAEVALATDSKLFICPNNHKNCYDSRCWW